MRVPRVPGFGTRESCWPALLLVHRLGELQHIPELIPHAKLTIAPRLALNALNKLHAARLKLRKQLFKIRREDMHARRRLSGLGAEEVQRNSIALHNGVLARHFKDFREA